jgi:hypothetical protein
MPRNACTYLSDSQGISKPGIVWLALHDIGHLVGEDQKLETMVSNGTNLGTKDHDKVGAAYLRNNYKTKYQKEITPEIRVTVRKFEDTKGAIRSRNSKVIFHRIYNKSNTRCATSVVGRVYPSGVPEFTPFLSGLLKYTSF